jgi:hypothetical protein
MLPVHDTAEQADSRFQGGYAAALLRQESNKPINVGSHFWPFAESYLLGNLEKGNGADLDRSGARDRCPGS